MLSAGSCAALCPSPPPSATGAERARILLTEQHQVRANITAGTVRTRVLPKVAASYNSIISSDFTRVASFASQSTVAVHSLADSQLLCQLELPLHPAWPYGFLAVDWAWDATGRSLTIPCQSPSNEAKQHGLMFLNTESGTCSTVQLQALPGSNAVDVSYSTSGSLALVHHVGPGSQPALSVFDCTGQLRASAACPAKTSMNYCCWAPSGRALALLVDDTGDDSDSLSAWLWDLQSAPVHVVGLARNVRATWMAWAIPAAACIIIGSDRQHATVASFHSQRSASALNPQHASWLHNDKAVWGTRLALLNNNVGGGYRHLELYTVQDSQLTLVATVTAGRRVFAVRRLALSQDGQLVAAVTGKSVTPALGLHSALRSLRLAVVHLATGRLSEYRLQGCLSTVCKAY